MVCEHLRAVDMALQSMEVAELSRGQAWGDNCREWVYYDCHILVEDVMKRFLLSDVVRVHRNEDPRSGTELGSVCSVCHDAIMGSLAPRPGRVVFTGATSEG